MRKIKFRGMDINGNWYYGLLAYTESTALLPGGKTGWFISNKSGSPWTYQVRPETIGQCTGLKDTSGRLIYEGDLLLLDPDDPPALVVWDKDVAMFCLEQEDVCYTFDNCGYSSQEMEVVGNIHENLELLEDK